MRISRILMTTSLLLCLSAPALADDAIARLHNADGESVGTVSLKSTPHGVLLTLRLAFMPPGVHAFHIHETGTCEPPFTSAGGHFNPAGTEHGILNEAGMHAGDMPNIRASADGLVHTEVLNHVVRLDDALFDDDGAAIVIHEGADDYSTDPAGNAGPRIACGVIEKI